MTPPNSKIVLIPDMLGKEGVEVLQRRPDIKLVRYSPSIAPGPFHALLADAAGVALSFTRFGQGELDAAPQLQVAARIGVGFDAVDVPALTARRVPLMVAGTANATSVAEHALFLMFALAKRSMEMDQRVRQGKWHDRQGGFPMELQGKTVLVIGFGRIGTRTAPRCAAFGMRVLVHDPHIDPVKITGAGFTPAPDLDAALAQADLVTIHCPRNAETRNMFDAGRLARMKQGAILVNTARGGIIDEPALQHALESGHLGAAGLDVFDNEPATEHHPLMKLPNVILSPHMAGITTESMVGMAVVTAQNILGVLDGAPDRSNAVNPEVFG